jgi:release factor glutamine methyltransferase
LLANPPYIGSDDPHLASGDVRFEPRSALVSAHGGLADLDLLVAGAPVQLHDGGWLLLEHGFEQAEAVRGMLRHAGFHQVSTRRDLAGQERSTGGCWHAD